MTDLVPVHIGTAMARLVEQLEQPLPSRLPVAVFCADSNPWDASVLCELPGGHSGRHQATFPVEISRWWDWCHFDGDDCETGAHEPDEPEAAS